MTTKPLIPLALALAAATATAQTEAPSPASAPAATVPAASPHTVTGNVAVVSDYRFRGISQSWGRPAIQGGIDYSHASGFYLGNWNSSVSSNSYNNGASLETDLYGGYKFEPAKDWAADAGVLAYVYPGSRLNSAPATPTGNKYDNTELYFGLSRGPFSAKLSYALTDYFGLNGTTAGYAYFNALPARGGSRGTTYLDLNYSADLGNQFTLGLHLGHTRVRNYGELSYTDYKLSLGKEWSGLAFNAAIVGTNADANFYQAGNSAGLNPRRLGRGALVVSVGKTF